MMNTGSFTANSPLVGADRILWATDYPHPDAKIPGITAELTEAIAPLSIEDQRLIAGTNASVTHHLVRTRRGRICGNRQNAFHYIAFRYAGAVVGHQRRPVFPVDRVPWRWRIRW